MSTTAETPVALDRRFTERQATAWRDDVSPVLAKHGIDATDPARSHYWTLTFAEETRPGRGHHLSAIYLDGEQLAQVTMDVYGYPTISVATLDWIHADASEELLCEDICGERPEPDEEPGDE